MDEVMQFQQQLQTCGAGPLLVHSALRNVVGLVGGSREPQAHMDWLQSLAGGRGLWFPTFNYQCLRKGTFDVVQDTSEVGKLTEYARHQTGWWRSQMPVFSIVAAKAAYDEYWPEPLNPFGKESVFHALDAQDGVLIFYGAELKSITYLHYIEWLAGGPVYRYDKYFPVRVEREGQLLRDVTVQYHVRPMGKHLDYDWPKLEKELVDAGVMLRTEREGVAMRILSARKLKNFWLEAMRLNPLYLLDAESLQWVQPLYEQWGRRFEIGDFE